MLLGAVLLGQQMVGTTRAAAGVSGAISHAKWFKSVCRVGGRLRLCKGIKKQQQALHGLLWWGAAIDALIHCTASAEPVLVLVVVVMLIKAGTLNGAAAAEQAVVS